MNKLNRKKDRDEKDGMGKQKRGLPGIILAAFAAAAVTYIVLLNVEKNVLSAYEKADCWMLAEALEKGTEITEDNMDTLFCRMQADARHIPQEAVEDPMTLLGTQAAIAIPRGSIVTRSMFTPEGYCRAALEHPVIAGCRAEDLYQLVSGTLRSGDRVHIYTVDEELGETYLVWEDVMVYQAFDSAGNQIPPQDTVSAAARINVLLEEGTAELFYSELYRGSLRVVKLWE